MWLVSVDQVTPSDQSGRSERRIFSKRRNCRDGQLNPNHACHGLSFILESPTFPPPSFPPPKSIGPVFTMISRAAAPSSSIASLSSRSLRAQAPAARSFATVQDNAPPVKHYGGLKDQDRIFTNLYGHHGADLKSAMKYGDWHRTKDIVLKGHDWVGSAPSLVHWTRNCWKMRK